MLALRLSKQAAAFLQKLPTKHSRQIAERIALLRNDQTAVTSIELKGYPQFKRFKSGEYRVVFEIDDANSVLNVALIGKRNDDEIYELVKRMLR